MKRLTTYIGGMALSIGLLTGCQFSNKTAQEQPEEVVEIDTRQFLLDICIDSLQVEKQQIKSGESLSTILSKHGVSAIRIDSLVRCSEGIFDMRSLRAGASYTLLKEQQDSLSTLCYFVYQNSLTDFIVFELGDNLHIYNYKKPTQIVQRTSVGEITSSLWNAMAERGTNTTLAINLSELYAWQIDFFGIDKGDWFKVLYNEVCVDDSITVGVGEIDGAAFHHHGRTFYAIPFELDSVKSYFDEEGQSLRKAFLKAPLRYSRVSSRFSNGRYHPVLKIVRPHHGVDYAAPAGTPVVTIGDGKVTKRGYQAKGGGNYITIKHNAMYTTTYMHLLKFAPNTEVGSSVKQGQLIAYVGSTGLSTGPHLDFRVYFGGKAIDPLKMESPSVDPIPEELMDSFNIIKERVVTQLEQLEITPLPTDTTSSNTQAE